MSDTTVQNVPRAAPARRRLRKIDAALRARIEAAIEAMITTLDALDAPAEDREEDDPGGEEGGASDDEPALGWTDFESRYGRYAWIAIFEDEPSLGWTATEASRGAKASGDDREDEHDGAEPDVDGEDGGDDEPSLETDDADLEPVRTDPTQIAKAREREQEQEGRVAVPTSNDGRFVFGGGRGSHLRALTAEHRKRLGLCPTGQGAIIVGPDGRNYKVTGVE